MIQSRQVHIEDDSQGFQSEDTRFRVSGQKFDTIPDGSKLQSSNIAERNVTFSPSIPSLADKSPDKVAKPEPASARVQQRKGQRKHLSDGEREKGREREGPSMSSTCSQSLALIQTVMSRILT